MHQTSEDIGLEFKYYLNDVKYETHCYIDMIASNLGVNVVNEIVYDYEDDTMYCCARQIYLQMAVVDPGLKDIVDVFNKTGKKLCLVRDKLTPNNYVLELPEMKVDSERQYRATYG